MRKFAVFDIDGTIFRSGLYREFVFELMRRGILPKDFWQDIEIKQQAWQKRSHSKAFKEFESTMVQKLDANLNKIRLTDYDLAAKAVMEIHTENVYVYTRDLIENLKSQGRALLAISGSQVELVEAFATHYGFDDFIGQTYERGEEFFTGQILKTHEGKGMFLKKLVSKHGLDWSNSIAVGDSMGDVEMFELVANPIAFNPDQNLFDYAKNKGWPIVVERKNVIYELGKGGHGRYELA